MTDRHELERVREQAARVYVKTTVAAALATVAVYFIP